MSKPSILDQLNALPQIDPSKTYAVNGALMQDLVVLMQQQPVTVGTAYVIGLRESPVVEVPAEAEMVEPTDDQI